MPLRLGELGGGEFDVRQRLPEFRSGRDGPGDALLEGQRLRPDGACHTEMEQENGRQQYAETYGGRG